MVVRDSAASIEAPVVSRVRYFDPAEANRALIYLRRVTEDITHAYEEVVQLRLRIESHGHTDTAGILEEAYKRAMVRLSDLVDELQQAGVELRDFESGTIDFPAISEQGELFLCWKLGEAAVEHWHDAESPCDQRRPISSLPRLLG
ncbi:DUF2203 domain-containing protein [Mucisphaera sp.]|uniref:DUF2203 domain-containing protein n=1 Tax=Mucisphaera sp. TaxID=2913024 RepID=UPI003D0F7950